MAGKDIVTPIMPTGSGLVDLEIAREPDTLAGGEVIPPERAPTDADAGVPQAESEAHPS